VADQENRRRAETKGGAPAPLEIPDKFFFKIGEVARLTDLPAHVLRYWETEFSELAPRKHGNGQRVYRRKEIDLILEIRDLLHRQRFTIEGARKELRRRRFNHEAAHQVDHWQLLHELRDEVTGLLAMLEADG